MVSWCFRRSALALGAGLLLAGCASTPRKAAPALPADLPAGAPASATVAPAPTDFPQPTAAGPVASQPPVAPESLVSPWDRLRARLAMPGCDYNPAVQRWARLYTQGPQRFSANLKRAAPFLLLVLDELERRDLPGEFAFLPYLESTYEPIPAQGNNAAGMWQFVPGTARAAGMQIQPGYDGRLDALASTRGAVDLLARYQEEFGDWRLVDMAFNAGEFGVKQMLRGQSDLSAEALGRLRLSPITHEHLAKLLALSCILSEPERYHVELPQLDGSERLLPVELERPIDLRVAQRLAGIDSEEFQRWNAAYRGTQMPSGAPSRLLLPEPARTRFLERYAQMPPEQWHDWSVVRLDAPRSVDELAQAGGVESNLLGVVNGVDGDRAFARGASVLLPSHAAASFGTPMRPATVPAPPAGDVRTHTVQPGDTLWDIARRYRLTLSQLLRWNGLGERATLSPGQRLRVAAPD